MLPYFARYPTDFQLWSFLDSYNLNSLVHE